MVALTLTLTWERESAARTRGGGRQLYSSR